MYGVLDLDLDPASHPVLEAGAVSRVAIFKAESDVIEFAFYARELIPTDVGAIG